MKTPFSFTATFHRVSLAGVIIALGATGPVLGQGFLTPPANGSLPLVDQALDALGNPESNMKSLTQIQPGQVIPSKDPNLPDLNGTLAAYTISTPGNYYLTENLVGDKPVVITSDDVTLDLSGFEMRFTGGAPAIAISVAPGAGGPPQRIHVRNGFIIGGWDAGVVLPDYCSVRDLNVSGASTFAISVGAQSTVHNCIVQGQPLEGAEGPMPHAGIFGGVGAVISHSTAREIHGVGIETDRTGRIVDCTSNCNLGRGIVGADGTSVEGCTSFMNNEAGIAVGAGSSVLNCSSHENFAAGYHLRTGSTLAHCTSRLNQGQGYLAEGDVPGEPRGEGAIGFPFSANGSSFQHCSATQNTLSGFQTTINSTFVHCTADRNGTPDDGGGMAAGSGFDLIDSCRVVNCMASNNFVHGIIGLEDNYLEQNTCHTNGVDGINLSSTANTVIKNYLKFNGGAPTTPAAGAGGIAPIVLPSAAAPNPFGNFAF